MEPLDLTQQIPRSPREQLDGLAMLPRTIDKARASLPGGNLGPYHIVFGLSGRLFAALGISAQEFIEAVRTATSDEDVAAWLRARTDPAKYAAYNDELFAATQDVISPDHRERFNALYSPQLREKYHRLCDLVDADDREIERERSGITG
jgi:hypothetical protein